MQKLVRGMLAFAVVLGALSLFGFVPFFKLNLWVTQHICPFFQPFMGFLLVDTGGSNSRSTTFFDAGLYTGVEALVTSWGFRVWTGFEFIKGNDTHAIGIPLRWALVVYF